MIPKASIRSVSVKVTSGGTPSRAKPEYFAADGSGHLWVKSKELQDGVIAETEERISDEGLNSSSAKYLPASTVLLAMYGANVGQLGWLRVPATLNQAICGLIINPDKADFRYVFYALMETRAGLIAQAQGAAQQNLNQDKIKDFEIPCPSLSTQRRIASVLSAYDDLIESNTRRIAILEEMARRIYEEWFVCFRFPGHENVRMVESELGLVPKGWDVTTLGAVCVYINRGLAPKYDDDAPGIVINQKCIRDQRLSLSEARRQSKPVAKEKLVMFGDVLINSTGVGTLGRVAQVMETLESCTVDTHVSIVRSSNDVDCNFFGLAMLSKQSHFEAQGVGSTGQTELSRARISDTLILLPTRPLQDQFGKLVQPIRQLAVRLQAKNANLRTTRDLLRPKLISGELDVSAMPEPEAAVA